MPELPEVEVIRRQLEPLVGCGIVDAWARPEPRWASAATARGTVAGVTRRGKFLLVRLDQDSARRWMVVHLGMTGRLELGPAGHAGGSSHVCAWWRTDDGRELVLCDPRRFGRAVVCDDPDDELPAMGPEPLDPDLDLDAVARALAGRGRGIKELLLEGRAVAGAGNYLADETLWRARVHPEARRLSRARARRVAGELVALMHASVEAGGASLRDYRSLAGRGRTQDLLQCYGHAGKPCARCGTVLVKHRVAGRGTTTCPRCQRRPRT